MIPTPRLLVALLLGAVVIAAATWAPGLQWLWWSYCAVLALLVLGDWLTTTRADQIDVRRENESKLSLGVDNLIVVAISSRAPRSLHLAVRDEYPDPFGVDLNIITHRLAPFGHAELRYHVRPKRRGDYRWGNTNVRFNSTLGLFQRQITYPTAAGVRVYPNVLDVRKYDLLARKGLLAEIGLRNARVYGAGTEFERLRDYTIDDEFRRINWKATARRNKPIAVEYDTERSQQIICLLDTGRLMRSPIGDLMKLDYAINTALLTSYVASLRGDQIGLLTFADKVGMYLAPDRGRSQFYSMLELLYNVHSEAVEADYARALHYLATKNRRRALIILFTDLQTLDAAQPIIAGLSRLARQHVALLVTISDPHVNRLANQVPGDSAALYQRAIAEQLLDERKVILDTLGRGGVQTLDVPADQLSPALINRYLELKGRGQL